MAARFVLHEKAELDADVDNQALRHSNLRAYGDLRLVSSPSSGLSHMQWVVLLDYLGLSLRLKTLQMQFVQGSLHRFQFQYPYGLTDQDIEWFKNIEGTSSIDLAYIAHHTTRI